MKKWRQNPHSITTNAHRKKNEHPTQNRLTDQQVKQGVLEGSIPSAAWYTVCTSLTGLVGGNFIQIEQRYNKIIVLEDGHPTPATNIDKLEHRVREPVRTVNMVPELANQSLLSGGKFAEEGYMSICDGDEVKIYYGLTATITVSEYAVLKGWR